MSAEAGALIKGWGWPMLSKKAHYFEGGTSLCGKWMYTGQLDEESGKRSPDDCKACTKKVLGAVKKVGP